jgi:hypothetical protein
VSYNGNTFYKLEDNTRKLLRDLGLGNQYIGNLTLRTQGWFRSIILFSRKLLKEGKTPLMTMDELRDYYYSVKNSVPLSIETLNAFV